MWLLTHQLCNGVEDRRRDERASRWAGGAAASLVRMTHSCRCGALTPACRPALPACAGQISLAYVTAATHGLVEDAERLGEQLGDARPHVDAAAGELGACILQIRMYAC